MVSLKELDERLRRVVAQHEIEERDWQEEERKLFELEETYLRDTIVHGNILTGWGEPKTAPVRFRNALIRRRKRERQEGSGAPVLTPEEQLKIDRHRLGSYSSVTSPAEPIVGTIAKRMEQLQAPPAATKTTTKATSDATMSTKAGTANGGAKANKKAKRGGK